MQCLSSHRARAARPSLCLPGAVRCSLLQELDRQRARGTSLAVDSPLLWEEEELEDLLQGGPWMCVLIESEAETAAPAAGKGGAAAGWAMARC